MAKRAKRETNVRLPTILEVKVVSKRDATLEALLA